MSRRLWGLSLDSQWRRYSTLLTRGGVHELTLTWQIYYDSLGKGGALGFMIVLCIVQYLIGLSLVSRPYQLFVNPRLLTI